MRRLLRRAWPGPGAPRRTRFLILARYRSGSNLLARSLGSHPRVVVLPELFNLEYLAGQPRWLDDPVAVARDAFAADYPGQPRAVGFKLMYQQASPAELELASWGPDVPPRIAGLLESIDARLGEQRDEGLARLSQLWDSLGEDRDLRVVHLTRHDRFAAYVSFRLAMREDNWVGESYRSHDLVIDPEHCEAWMAQGERLEREYDVVFSDHPVLKLDYGELRSDLEASLERVFRFLGLRPVAVEAPLPRQRRKPLAELVANYAELERRFRGTRWRLGDAGKAS